MSTSIVVVATFLHRHEAEMARGYLDGAGIQAAVSVDDGGAMFGMPLAFTEGSYATVAVREEEAPEARRVLRNAGLLPEEDEEDEGIR